MMKLLPALLLGLLLLPACGGNPADDHLDAVSACYDLADEYGKLCARCSPADQQQAAYDSCAKEVKAQVGGDCADARTVRDEAALRSTCFTWLRTVACASVQVAGAKADSSCRDQLHR
jgi:hypothetical protein